MEALWSQFESVMGTTTENVDVDRGADDAVERMSETRAGADVSQRREVEMRNGHAGSE